MTARHDTRERAILVWLGKITSVFMMVLFVGILICYLFKPDNCAALTFFPAWAWGLLGVTLSAVSLLYKKRIHIALILCWLIFILIFA
ncbi:MAG: hypothetical protein ACYSUH_06970, partial [Planctomycetota bacterium]